jgi:hypothetical protein
LSPLHPHSRPANVITGVEEMLKHLLFWLDSVRSVRDYKNKVIRKVISLQEFIGWTKSDAFDSIWEATKDSFLDGVHGKGVAIILRSYVTHESANERKLASRHSWLIGDFPSMTTFKHYHVC